MTSKRTWQWLSLAALTVGTGTLHAADINLGEISVTGTREETPKAEIPATVDSVDDAAVEFVHPAHPTEIMGRIAGVHVNVTNGEGHATAIRHPITTGAVYLFLEDGIPTRSTGFFNHNALYETNLPQAAGIEVTKGPGTALYGSDAIGGIVNVITKATPLEPEAEVNLEVGEAGWRRLLGSAGTPVGDGGVRADINLTHTDGWRDGTEYDRQSANLRWDGTLGAASVKALFTASDIEQQTAGTSRLSEVDYKDNPTRNYTPISFRNVQAYRFSVDYEKEDSDSLLSVTPYVRSNSMEYMPNWSLGYDPNITETGHNSFGLQLKYRKDFAPNRTRLVVGADIDYSPGERLEHSIDPFKNSDNIYERYTLGEVIYDYDVTYLGVSPYLHLETSISERARVTAGVRYDDMQYDYDNKMADGALVVTPWSSMPTRTVTYNHPSDTTVSFSHLSPKLGLTYLFADDLNGFASYRRAFRAPSEGDIFRPGKSDASLNLDAVKVDSYELGLRGRNGSLDYELSIYHMLKTDDLVSFKDPVTDETYTANAGETLHQGVEITAGAPLADDWRLEVSYSYSKHTYEDWIESGNDYSGKEIPSAPNQLVNARLGYTPALLNGGKVELEWERLGAYWMDNENTERYAGHDLFNLRANYLISKTLEIYGRVINLTDERYATAASLSGGAPQFAPGAPRTVYAGLTARF
jgi:Outer membrane receptor proteins, mostly Fe transport